MYMYVPQVSVARSDELCPLEVLCFAESIFLTNRCLGVPGEKIGRGKVLTTPKSLAITIGVYKTRLMQSLNEGWQDRYIHV